MHSHYDYKVGQKIAAEDYPFYALLQALLRKADTDNFNKLSSVFPEEVAELRRRIEAPCGLLPGEEAWIGGSLYSLDEKGRVVVLKTIKQEEGVEDE